ncbi:MAG: hypothetical protein ACI4TK_14405 [Agathobacter sp.]
MREIGGYIEFETYKGTVFHENAIALNCGRNCLAYLLRAKQIKKILLPYFLCDSVTNICKQENIEVRNYHINEFFIPKDVSLKEDEWLYLVNYYGQLSHEDVRLWTEKYNRVIVDNAQAYFEMPLPGVDTIYTCRKFLGVPDGAFLYTNVMVDDATLPFDESFERMHFLLGRFERTASEYYDEYVANNKRFATEKIKHMSKLTMNLLRGIDYEGIKKKRTQNFEYLFEKLKDYNILKLRMVPGAFAYPLMLDDAVIIRKELQKNKIYIPTLWPNVLADTNKGSIEYNFAQKILPMPCDQRYDIEDMQYICDVIKEIIGS